MNRFYLLISIGLLFGSCQKDTTPPQAAQVSETKLFRYGGVLDEADSYYWLDVFPNRLTATVVLDNQAHTLVSVQAVDTGKSVSNRSLTDGTVTLNYAYDYSSGRPTISVLTPTRQLANTIGTVYDYRMPELAKRVEPIALYTGTLSDDYPGTGEYVYNMALDFTNRKYAILSKIKDQPAAEAVKEEGYFWETKTAIELGGYSPYMVRSIEDDSTLDFQKNGTALVCNLSATQAGERGMSQFRIELEKH